MQTKWNVLGLGVVVLGLASHAQASGLSKVDANDPYYQISSVQSKVISSTVAVEGPVSKSNEKSAAESTLESNLETSDLNSSLGNASLDVPSLGSGINISIGGGGSEGLEIADMILKVWDIIERNQPVNEMEVQNATALPKAANQNWQSLVGWMPERRIRSSLVIKNGYGMKVIDLTYDVVLLAGGNLNGKGQYIQTARVIPTHVNVLWAFKLNVKVNVAAVYNMRTKQDPLAAVNLDVQYKYGGLLGSTSGTDSFMLRGDGLMKNLGDGSVYYRGTSSVAQ